MALTKIKVAAMSANSVDSDQYVDASIDTAHIGDDQVTVDKLANSINTDIAAKAPIASPTFTGTVAIPNIANLETAVTANTAKVTNATHTGDVTGSTSLTIANDSVDGNKLANNIDIAGTLDVTSTATFDSGGSFAGRVNFGSGTLANIGVSAYNDSTTAGQPTIYAENDQTSGNLFLGYGAGALKVTITGTGAATFAGDVSDSKGNVRSIPQNTQGSTYTLVAADAGKHILASGTVTVPDSVFAAGDAVTIVNNTASDLTITKTITTMYMSTDGTSANRTLATRGMATILFASGTVAYISGAGLS